MKKKTFFRKICLTIILVASIPAFASTVAYAFFTSDSFKNINGSITGSDAVVRDISSFSDLWKYSAGAKDETVNGISVVTGKYNDESEVSDKTERAILRLQKDVTLEADLIFDTDVHIDLNSHTVYLNGRELVISHSYHGSTLVSNGVFVVDEASEEASAAGEESTRGPAAETAKGKVYFDAPYSVFTLKNVTFKLRNGDVLSADDYALNVSGNDKITAYKSIKAVSLRLIDYSDTLPERIKYAELLNSDEAFDKTFESGLFLAEKFCAAATETAKEFAHEYTKEACAFVFSDLDLLQTYKAYPDISVEYSSSDESVLDNFGKKGSVGSITDVDFTVTVKRTDEILGKTTFKLHVVPGDEASLITVGKTLICARMQGFYKNAGGDGAAENVYAITRSLQLPRKIDLPNGKTLNFEYSAYDSDGNSVSGAVSDGTDKVCVLEPSSSVTKITAAVKVSDTNGSGQTSGEGNVSFSVTASDAGLIITDSSYAQDFIITNYGGQIKIIATENDGVYSFMPATLFAPDDDNAHKKITSVKYTLVNDTNGLYRLENCDAALLRDGANGTIYVAQGKNPLNYVQDVQVNCEFEIDGGETVNIQIPVHCSAENGSNVSEFLPYYNLYDQMFFSTTGCYTIKSFVMPFASGGTASDFAVCYDMYSVNENGEIVWNEVKGITVSFSYNNGTAVTLTPAVGTDNYSYASYVNALNAYLKANGLEIKDIAEYGDAKWTFTVNVSAVGDVNQDFFFAYNYARIGGSFSRFADSSQKIMNTAFTLPGVLVEGQGEGRISDEYLFDYLGNVFGGDGFASEYDSSVIIVDWLKQNLPVDVTDETYGNLLKSVTVFDGLKYLQGTTKVNLEGVTSFSGTNYAANLAALFSITSLEELSLKSCNLGRGTGTSPVETELSGITALKNLKTLNLADNDVYSFDFLLGLSSLNVVKVYDNLDANSVEGIFYGSEGLVNMEYFAELSGAGVLVYNLHGSNDILFTETSGINDYKCLQSVEYQKKIKENQEISSVYAQFVNASPSDFGLKESYTVGGTTYSVTGRSLAWGYDGDDTTATKFYVEYSLTCNGTSVKIKVYFDVVRVAAKGGTGV